MGHSLSADKRERQNEVRRIRNKVNKIVLKKELKAFDAALHEKDADLKSALSKAQGAIDLAVRKNIIPKGRANRKKSRLASKITGKQTETAAT